MKFAPVAESSAPDLGNLSSLRRAKTLPSRDPLALIEGSLTPAVRLRLIVRQIRNQRGPRDERRIDVAVDRAVRKVRGARATGR